MRKLEEQAAEQGMRTLWKVCLYSSVPTLAHLYRLSISSASSSPRKADEQGAKLEVEAVVREACEQVLTDPSISHEKRVLRATALNLAAEAFLSIKKEGEAIEEFVRVDTPASKQREGVGAGRPPVPPPRPDTTDYPKEKSPAATSLPPRSNANRPTAEAEETLGAAYKACKSFRVI